MLRIVVIGNSEAVAQASAEWCCEGEKKGVDFEKKYEIEGRSLTIQALPVCPEQKAPKPIAQAVVIVCKSEADFALLEPIVQNYIKVPIKFVLHDGVAEQVSIEAKWGAKGLEKKDPKSFANEVIKANNDLIKLVAQVFKGFDKDNSGFIDLKEIVAVGKELGTTFTEGEAAEIINELDTNKDGKVSLEEFVEWWKSGRQGKKDFGGLLSGWMKKNKIVSEALSKFSLTGEELKEGQKHVEASFAFHVNKVTKPGVMLDFKFMSKGKELTSEFQAYAEAVGVAPDTPFFGIGFGSPSPASAKETLENLVQGATMMATGLIPKAEQALGFVEQKFGQTTSKAVMVICPSEAVKPLVGMVMEQVKPIASVISPDQLLEFTIAFATDLNKIANSEAPVYDSLMEGVSLSFKASIAQKFTEKFHDILKDESIKGMIPPKILKKLLPLALVDNWIAGSKGEIEFEIDPELKAMIQGFGAATPFALPVSAAKGMFGEQAKGMISQIPMAEAAYNLFKDQVTSIEFFIYLAGFAGLKFRFDLPGLKELLKLD